MGGSVNAKVKHAFSRQATGEVLQRAHGLRNVGEHAVAGDKVKSAAESRGKPRIGQVGRDKADVARLAGAPLQAPGDRKGAGAEVDGDDFRMGELPPKSKSLGSVSASGHQD